MTITEYFLAALVGGIAAIVVALLTQGLQFFKWKNGEKTKIDSESANQIAEAAAELIEPFRVELQASRKENGEFKKYIESMDGIWKKKLDDVELEWNVKFSSLQVDYIEIQKELALFKNWVERLIHQVYSLGGSPVPMVIKLNELDKMRDSKSYFEDQTQPLNPINPDDIQE